MDIISAPTDIISGISELQHQQGTATASLILRKLSAYPRQEVRSRFGLLRTLAFRDALMGKASCFLWSRRMGCGKTSARSR